MITKFPNGSTHIDAHQLALELAFGRDKLLPQQLDAKGHADLSQCLRYRQLMRHLDRK